MSEFEQLSISFQSDAMLAFIDECIRKQDDSDQALDLVDRQRYLMTASGLVIASYTAFMESQLLLDEWRQEEGDIYDNHVADIIEELNERFPMWVPLVFVPLDLNGMTIAILGRSNELRGLAVVEPKWHHPTPDIKITRF